MSVTLQLDEEIDLSRGDMLVSPDHLPKVSRKIPMRGVVWLHGDIPRIGPHLSRKTHRSADQDPGAPTSAIVSTSILWRKKPATRLEMNEIGSVEFETHVPLFLRSLLK